MTREEAIAILEVSKHMATSGRMYNQAIDMAIEALSEPNRKPDYTFEAEMVKRLKAYKQSGDLISRADAIDALGRSSIYAWSIEQDQTAHNWALNIIKALPSAEAEEYDDYEHATLVDIKEPLKVSVVRCKDCKNWRESHSEDEESYCYIDGRTTDSTDYCSWGKRREP